MTSPPRPQVRQFIRRPSAPMVGLAPARSSTRSDRQRWIYILLWLLFPFTGLHNFYRRAFVRGFIQLLAVPVLLLVVPFVAWKYYPEIERVGRESDPGSAAEFAGQNFMVVVGVFALAAVVYVIWFVCELFASKDADGRRLD